MEITAENTRRIARNTILLYIRSLFNLFVALYSSRLVLQALGVVDYGINNVVGGFVSMFWLVTGSLSSAVSRFLTFELGRDNKERLDKVFSLSLNILLMMSALALILAETFGIWFLQNEMTIPPERAAAAGWVFQFSVFTVISGFIIVPYNADIIAHERMGLYAWLGIGETLIKLFIALFLVYGHYSMDRLILYSLLWMLSTFAMRGVAIFYCHKNFSESRFRWIFDKGLFKELLSFAGWTFAGSISSTFSNHGVNIILNTVFGPVINTARGLAGTVGNAISIFVNNFTTAIKPQVTKAYASGNMDYMKSLVFRGCKFSLYIMFFFTLPLCLETVFAMNLWLRDYPEHTIAFVRLALIISMCDLLYLYFAMAQHATGDIKRYKLVISVISFMVFPLSYIMLKAGLAPEIVYIVAIAMSLCSTVWTIMTVKRSLGFTFSEIFRRVYAQLLIVILSSTPIPLALHLMLPFGYVRFLIVGTVCVICSTVSILWLGCNEREREYIFGEAKAFLKKFRR